MEPRGVWAASDSSARARSVMPPAARKQPLPAAEIDGAEVSWALPYRNAQAAYPRAAPAVGEVIAAARAPPPPRRLSSGHLNFEPQALRSKQTSTGQAPRRERRGAFPSPRR